MNNKKIIPDFLENELYEYIQKNQIKNIDSVDIVIYFKLRADIILEALSNLQKKNKVKREYMFGTRYRYVCV